MNDIICFEIILRSLPNVYICSGNERKPKNTEKLKQAVVRADLSIALTAFECWICSGYLWILCI
jgi:hypothetical protein